MDDKLKWILNGNKKITHYLVYILVENIDTTGLDQTGQNSIKVKIVFEPTNKITK